MRQISFQADRCKEVRRTGTRTKTMQPPASCPTVSTAKSSSPAALSSGFELLCDDASLRLEDMHGKLLCVSLTQASERASERATERPSGSLRHFTAYVREFKLVKTDGFCRADSGQLIARLSPTGLQRLSQEVCRGHWRRASGIRRHWWRCQL